MWIWETSIGDYNVCNDEYNWWNKWSHMKNDDDVTLMSIIGKTSTAVKNFQRRVWLRIDQPEVGTLVKLMINDDADGRNEHDDHDDVLDINYKGDNNGNRERGPHWAP